MYLTYFIVNPTETITIGVYVATLVNLIITHVEITFTHVKIIVYTYIIQTHHHE